MEDNLFPQANDPNDAKRFAQLLGASNNTDYVEWGLEITPDFEHNLTSVSDGICYVSEESAFAGTDSRELYSLGYVAQVRESTVETPYDVNYISVKPEDLTQDSVRIDVYSDTAAIPTTELLIGTVDMNAETVVEHNREPNITAESLRLTGVLENVVYESISDIPGDMASEGAEVYTTQNGLVVYDTTGSTDEWMQVSAFDDVTDIDHDQTSNRTHSGDDLEPDSISVLDVLKNATYTSISNIPDALANNGAEVFTAEDGLVVYDETGNTARWKTIGAFETAADIDHNQTSNRTHSGDDIEPNSVTIGSVINNAVYTSVAEIPVSLETEGAEVFTTQDGLVVYDTSGSTNRWKSIGAFETESDIDHNKTSNRTHDGDDLTPASITLPDGGLNLGTEDPATLTDLQNHTNTSGAHHTRYADTEAVSAVNAEASLSVDIAGDADTLDGNHAGAFASAGHGHAQLHTKYTDSEAVSAVNAQTSLSVDISGDADTLNGYIPGDFASSGHGHSQLHTKYTDSEAVTAVNARTSLSVNISGDADTVDGQDFLDIQQWVNNNADVPEVGGWELQKNGTDGAGIINFKTN